MRELLEAGVHFGHQTRRWNPKMRRYIFGERGGIYIIDLTKTLELLEESHEFVRNIADRGGTVLFVGTKKQAQDAVSEQAKRVGMPYVNHRWLGGLLTNWRTISERIAYLHDLRRLKAEGQLDLLPSKERLAMEADLEKLEANLGGVADMKRQPDAVFVIDLKKEQLAVRETQRLGVPVIGLVDTNADPDEANFVIPGNDDAIRSCNLITRVIADGIAAGKMKVTATELATDETPPAEEPVDVSLSPSPSSSRQLRLPKAVRASERHDQRLTRQGAPRPDRRGDDGLQASSRGDGRRSRERARPPTRARDGVCGQTRGSRNDRGSRRLHHRREHGLDPGDRLRDRAGIEEQRVPGVCGTGSCERFTPRDQKRWRASSRSATS